MRSTEGAGEESADRDHQIERHWIAVRGDRVVAKADTKPRAATSADQLGEEYSEVVAVPKGGVPSGPF